MQRQRVTLTDLLTGAGPAVVPKRDAATLLGVSVRSLERPQFLDRIGLCRRKLGHRVGFLSLDLIRVLDESREPRP